MWSQNNESVQNKRTMKITFQNQNYATERLGHSIFDILSTVELCSIATVGSEGEGHINTAFFCYTDDLHLYFVSDPSTKHCQNIARSPRIAVGVCDTHQPW